MNTLIYKHRLILLILLAIIVDFLPYIRLPFVWTETFFHEISHGIAALVSGGSIISITLNYDGSGLCVNQGGRQFLVSFFGYAGSSILGTALFLVTEKINSKTSTVVLLAIEAIILIALLLWARTLSTYIILILIFATLALASRLYRSKNLNYFLKFLAVFVVLDAIRSPLALLDGRHVGDGAALSRLTFIPEMVWVIVWFMIGVSCLYWMYLSSYRKSAKTRINWA